MSSPVRSQALDQQGERVTTSGRPARPEAAADIPSTEEALSRLDMPLGEAMRTQRAIRKLHLDPVSHDVLLPLLEPVEGADQQ